MDWLVLCGASCACGFYCCAGYRAAAAQHRATELFPWLTVAAVTFVAARAFPQIAVLTALALLSSLTAVAYTLRSDNAAFARGLIALPESCMALIAVTPWLPPPVQPSLRGLLVALLCLPAALALLAAVAGVISAFPNRKSDRRPSSG